MGIKTSVDGSADVSFAANSNQEIRAWFNDDVTIDDNVTLADLQKYLMADLPATWSDIKAAVVNQPICPYCAWLLEIFSADTKFESIDVHHSSVVGVIDGIVANTDVPSFTIEDKVNILAMGTRLGKRWSTLGEPQLPLIPDIEKARNQ